MESDCSSSYSCDGGTVLADGAVLKPDGGYTKSDCGYYANYLPCYAGKYDWTPVRVDLGSLAGHQNVKLQFTFASDSTDSTPGKAGWSLDDVLVAALPVPPTADTRLVAPPQADVDPRQSDAIPLTVQAPGSDPSPPGKVLAQWYRQGVALGGPLSLGYPGLPAGGNWALAAPLPDGPADGLTLVARLADTSGAPLADGDPADDVATVALTASRVLATLGADSPALVMGDPGAPGFVVAAPPTATGAPKQAIVAGLGISPLAPAQSLVLGPVYLGGDDVLAFRQFARFGPGDGAFVQGSSDGGLTWTTLDPQGGYPTTGGQDMKCSDSDRSARCTTTSGGWQDVRVGLSALAGSQALLRVAYHAAATGRDGGLALADLRILGPAGGDATLGAARWAVGPIHNPAGPLEEASQPNAWGTGLEAKSARSRAFDVLASAPVDSHAMQDPVLSFDWYGVPEDGARLLAQARDPLGNWRTIGQLTGPTSVWEHVAFPLGAVGDVTQVRLLATTPGGKPGGAKAGYFVDDLLVGSLRGELTPVLDGFHVTPGDPVPALEASTFTVPVRLVNAGAFTNRYRLEARGVDPQWVTVPGPAITLAPGEAVTTSVGVRIPYVRDEGVYPLVLVARSLFDPLQQATADLLVNLKVAPKPDYVVKRVDFQSSFASPGDPVRHVEDAKPNTIVAEVENVGRASSTRDLDVLFLEHYANGDVRPIDTAVVPTSNLTSPDEPHHAPYGAFVEWFPRKGVVGIEVIANPDSLGNPIPLNPESSFANNAAFTPVAIEPRPLPELTLAAPPGFSRLPQVGQAVTIGVDVRNGGNAPTANPVDVAVLANPQDAFLESPAFRIPSHSLLRLEYSSDLETRADGFVVEMKDDGASAYERIAPTGGYPNGCLSGLLCQSGVSGRADHRVLTFDLSGHEGTVQLRLRFAMDSHNGRTYDGLRLHALRIQQFASTPVSFDFGQSSSGWTAGPTYTGRDGNAATVWQYSPREGVVPGAWTIPTGYLNPYLVALKPVKPIPTGNLEHVDLDWVPQAGGDTPLVVLIDPKNLEPEFLDDLNHNDAAVRVAVSGFAIQTTHTAGCPATVNLCLPDAAATADFPVQLANTGNTRAAFDVKLREHPFLEAQLLVQGRPVTSVELDPGATLDAVLHVHAVAAPADLHVLQVDVTDRLVGKASKVGIPVQVLSGATGASPAKLTGDLAFNVVASAKRVLTLENPTNKAIPVLLRSGAKPSGLALSLQPNEFTLAPFESRTVQLELLNLGVVAGPYTVPIVNSRVACPSGSAATCGEVGELAVKVAAYAPPRGDFTVVDAHPRPNIPVRFRDASTATGSTVTGWSWDFGDGATSTDADPSHTYLRPGLYQVRLTVTDAEGQEGPAEDQTVAVANDPPTALAALLSPKPLAGHLLNFSALGSLDADGGIAKVTWAFGDGGLGLGVNTTHTYRSPGTYHVTVAVEDLFGAVTLKEMQVTVASADAVNEAAASSGSNGSPAPVAVFALAVLLACALVRRRRA
jgi:PKD repeat protein